MVVRGADIVRRRQILEQQVWPVKVLGKVLIAGIINNESEPDHRERCDNSDPDRLDDSFHS